MQRIAAANGVVYYQSEAMAQAGVPHAFSTRLGGLSGGPFASLNLGNPNGHPVQDDYARIWSNYHRLQAACGCPVGDPCRMHQVHGARVLHLTRGAAFDCGQKADALVSDDPERVASVRVADCVPVLLASGDGRRVAAVHAGWRGVVAGVVGAAVAELVGHGGDRGQVLAAIGPCIGFDAFEVGLEVVEQFERLFGAQAPVRRCADGKGRVDLRQGARRQLLAAGVPAGRIDVSDRCTCRDSDEFFSHRRENGLTGRMAAIISARRAG